MRNIMQILTAFIDMRQAASKLARGFLASAVVAVAMPSMAQQEEAAEEVAEVDVDERIEVIGYRWFPESLSMTGRYDLNRDFLDFRSKGNGNITDMLTFLPGIQVSEDSFNVDRQQEIRSQLISISGAQPWQTGFYFDGLSNNSRIDPNAAYRSPASINDVQGHPQNVFVNQQLVGEVSVYDSNVPASYSGFNGGVVDVKTRKLDHLEEASVSLRYRRSLSSWNNYQYIDKRDALTDEEEENAAFDNDDVEIPDFAKATTGLTLSLPLTERHKVMASVSRTTSTIGEVSLNQPVETERESVSSMLKYLYLPEQNPFIDRLSVNASYSPYEGQHILVDVLGSEFSQEGGGHQFSVDLDKQLGAWQLSAKVGYSDSENSRTAPSVYLPWLRAPGKSWGVFKGENSISAQGGYGDLNKNQQDLSARFTANRDAFDWLGVSHNIDWGISGNNLTIDRHRPRTTLKYNAPYRDANINCNGQSLDCVEQQYQIPLDELAAQLGGSIDLSDPDELQAYQDNITQRGQFFRYRRVYPIEDINVEMNEYSAYVDDQISLDDWDLRLGLRLDYNDFLKNIDVAPRIQLGYKPWKNGQLVAGLNRYYAASLATYKLREARRPYITQLRTISQGEVGDWLTSNSAERFRYRFDGVETPYNDEFSLAYKQRLWGGLLSLKGVKRWQRQQLARGNTFEDDGITYIASTNKGSGEYERITLSYQYRWRNHEFWFHTSHSNNLTSNESYDSGLSNVPEDEIVALGTGPSGKVRYQLISQDDLNRRNNDYSRPVTANLSIHSQWTEALRSSFNVSYHGKYTNAVATGSWYFQGRQMACEDCDSLELAYPIFYETERPARTTVNGALYYQIQAWQTDWQLDLEVDNLLDQRTYSVVDGQAGIEPGRSFWLGISMTW